MGKHWWQQEKNDVHDQVTKTVENIIMKQAHRSEDNLRNMRLYGNVEVLGFRAAQSYNFRHMPRLSVNVIKMATDTICARIGKTKPKPTFLTNDGDFALQRQAKLLELFCTGQFYQLKLYDLGPKILRDACIFGDGFAYFYIEDGKIKVERVFPEEIVIDEDEAVHGNPKQIHRVKFMKKYLLQEKYPELTVQIENAQAKAQSLMFDALESDMVRVIESWRIKTKGTNGRHTITLNNVTILDEEYDCDYFPFERMNWDDRVLGYFSQGVAEALTGIQIEINKLLKTIQMAMHLGSIPKILVENGSKINSAHLNNEIGGVIKYSGTKPDSMALMNVPPELFMQLDKLYLKAFELVGLSPLSATSQKPAGLNSGKALREFHDMETERFSVHAQKYEDWYMRCSALIIKMAKSGSVAGDYESVVIDGKAMKKIKWSDIKLDESQYVMRVYPSNFLSETPAGRLSDIQDLIAIGLVTPAQAKMLLDYPDLESAMSLDNAVTEDAMALIEGFLEGRYSPPEQLQMLDQVVPIIQLGYLKYRHTGVGEDKLDLFRRYIDESVALLMAPQEEMEAEEPTESLEDEAMLLDEMGMDDMMEEEAIADRVPTEGELI